MKFLALIALVSFSLTAFADQCAWNTKKDADSAKKLIRDNKDIMLLCQNCGEKRPSLILTVSSIKTEKASNEIKVTAVPKFGKGAAQDYNIDLAYTYVRTGSDMFTNIAHLVGCPNSGSTSFIQTSGGKKSAHFYDVHGERTEVSLSQGDIRVEEVMASIKDRGPASVKK